MNGNFNNYGQNGYMSNGTYQNGSYGQQMMSAPISNAYHPTMPQQNQQMSYAPQRQMNTAPQFGDWVDGLEAAKVYPFPPGWPVETPLTLWDINQDVFYVRMKDSFGRPTPIKKARFIWEDVTPALPGQSGTASLEGYATKDDLQNMKQELMEAMRSSQQSMRQGQPQNGNRNGGAKE